MINRTIVQGRLVRAPELRTTQSGTSVCSFTVAWSEKYGESEIQLFLDCTAWRGTGELVSKHFDRGKEILVEGRLETQKWVDNDGNNRSAIKMTVDRAHFCGPKQSDSSGAYQSPGAPGTSDFSDIPDDGELPFNFG